MDDDKIAREFAAQAKPGGDGMNETLPASEKAVEDAIKRISEERSLLSSAPTTEQETMPGWVRSHKESGLVEDAPTRQEAVDVTQEMWKQIQQAACESPWIKACPDYTMNDWVADLCKFLRQGHPEREGWIPCSERMPERYRHVLVCCDDGTVPRALMQHDGERWLINHSDRVYGHKVTHWQPLPTAPSSEGADK